MRMEQLKAIGCLIALGLGFYFIVWPIISLWIAWQKEVVEPLKKPAVQSVQATVTPTPEPVSTPTPTFIDLGSKVVVVSKQLVFESRAALHKGRANLQSGKSDDEIDAVINRMIKDGECSQLRQYMRATVIDIQGDDVQIQQREGPYGAKWWIEKSAAQ